MKRNITKFIVFFTIAVLALPLVANANEDQSIHDEIIYDIVIDRFNNGSQAPSEQVDIDNPLTYNGGDIKGITDKLDTIQEHGFTAISLSPIMKNAPQGYHGYWIEDFYKVEEEFGSMEDLQELIAAAHEREMKVFIELVTNYTAKSSPLAQDESKKDWFTEVSATPIEATYWLKDVVQFNQTHPEVEAFFIDLANFWMDEINIDGYVLHASDQASEAFLDRLTTHIKDRNPHFYIIAKSLSGESIEDLCSYEAIDALADERLLTEVQKVFAHVDSPISQLYEATHETKCEKMLLFADHKETARFSNLVADQGRNAVTSWTLALTYLYFSPGIPLVYQGSEVPMYGPGFPENQMLVDSISADPDLKKVYERLSSTRKMFPALVHGNFEQVATDQGFSLFKRSYAGEVIYFGINNDSESRFVTLDEFDEKVQLRGLFHDDTIRMNDDGQFIVSLNRESAEVFIVQANAGINWIFIGLVSSIMLLFIFSIIFLTVKQRSRERE